MSHEPTHKGETMKEVTVFVNNGEIVRGYMSSIGDDGVYLINIKTEPYTNYKELFISNSAIKMIAYH